uniref:Uncharacterized protein n=1 Tax=Ascaris lumbricoides TaxID=6252 RepID=A0A9J2Q7F6_ASCLU
MSSTNMSEILDSSSSLEATMKLSEQNSACSLIEELLDTPGGNASIFERTLLEVSTQWQPWQKAHIAQLTRRVHHIMTLGGVDMSHKIEAIQRLTALDLWRNQIVKRMLLPYWIPNFGKGIIRDQRIGKMSSSLSLFFFCDEIGGDLKQSSKKWVKKGQAPLQTIYCSSDNNMNVIFALVICGTTFGMPIGYKTSSSPSFPETIWLGGLIPYKIDKRFEQLVNKALNEENDASSPLLTYNNKDIEFDTDQIYREDKFSGSKLLGTIGNEDERWHYRALTPFTNDATATIASSKDFSSLKPAIPRLLPPIPEENNDLRYGFDDLQNNQHSGETNHLPIGSDNKIMSVNNLQEEELIELENALDKQLEQILSVILGNDDQITATATPITNTATDRGQFEMKKMQQMSL